MITLQRIQEVATTHNKVIGELTEVNTPSGYRGFERVDVSLTVRNNDVLFYNIRIESRTGPETYVGSVDINTPSPALHSFLTLLQVSWRAHNVRKAKG